MAMLFRIPGNVVLASPEDLSSNLIKRFENVNFVDNQAQVKAYGVRITFLVLFRQILHVELSVFLRGQTIVDFERHVFNNNHIHDLHEKPD